MTANIKLHDQNQCFLWYVKVKVTQVMSDFATPWTLQTMGIVQVRILEWVAMPSSNGSSQPRIKPRFLTLQVDSLPTETPGKPKNTGVGEVK